MYTSDKRILKDLRTNLIAAVFTALFGAIYEHFSHDVSSNFMIYAFAVPLVMGALPYSFIAARGRGEPNGTALRLWNSAIAALTVGSVFKGVLDIYGTTNRLLYLYPVLGAVLAVAAVVMGLMPRERVPLNKIADTK